MAKYVLFACVARATEIFVCEPAPRRLLVASTVPGFPLLSAWIAMNPGFSSATKSMIAEVPACCLDTSKTLFPSRTIVEGLLFVLSVATAFVLVAAVGLPYISTDVCESSPDQHPAPANGMTSRRRKSFFIG